MLNQLTQTLGALDVAALLCFGAAWAGYGWYADARPGSHHGLLGMSHRYRVEWAREMIARDNRISDAALMANLAESVSFYANTTIYIIAGLLAVLGALDRLISVAAELPFARSVSREVWELKVLLLLVVFVVAYFKFTWALRQFNFLSIMVGAAPAPTVPEAQREHYAQQVGRINGLAGDDFNRGIRAYYFGIAAVSWFLHPVLLIAVTAAVVAVLYRRDFHSQALAALRDGMPR